MAQRDYVARSQKKRQPVKKQKKPVQAVAWIKVVFAILVVCSFVLGLWYLKDTGSTENNNGDPSSPSENISANQTSVQDANKLVSDDESIAIENDPLPVLGEEEWEFIEGLPSYSVEVDVSEIEDSGRRYLMQCGSFRTQSQAEELKAKIAFQGLESQVLQSKGSKGIWFRVVLGPYENKRTAEKDRHALRSARVNRCQIWNWE